MKAISPTLGELSKNGMEFRVTARVAGKLPKVNWPVRPQFTAGGAPGVSGLAFEWDNTAFVCPGCGESFLFRRLGKLQLAEAPVVVGSNGAEAAQAAAAPAMAARSAAPQPVKASVSGSNDMGFAEAADCPVISLFGPTRAAKAAPRVTHGITISAQDFGSPHMRAITWEAVNDAIEVLLARKDNK